jgi:competence protein ComFA
VIAFVCPRCLNADPVKIGIKQGQFYCRACITFIEKPWIPAPKEAKSVPLTIPYTLTPEQLTISYELIRCYKRNQSVMIDAVTGSGKTELVFRLIQFIISEGKSVGFVIPRTDVVRELAPRFSSVFPSLKITSVFGDHHDELEGDIVILTTHQIYRYKEYFDVLIFDEVDAFPYRGNQTLEAFVKRAVKGIIIYLSATFTHDTLRDFKSLGGQVFHLFKRFHGVALPEITIQIQPFFIKWIGLVVNLYGFAKKQQSVFIFVPTIRLGKQVLTWLSIFFPKTRFAFSSSPTRTLDVEAFKQNQYAFLITTAILERGITLANLQVILFAGDHPLMTTAMLIQMAGRVGRKKTAPTGKVIALVDYVTPALKEANAKITFANDHL